MSLASMMNMSAVLQRPTISRDSAGGTTQTYETVTSDMPCAVNEGGAGIKMLYGQRNAEVGSTIIFLCNPNTQPNDRLVITNCTAGTSKTYLVRGQSFPTSKGRIWIVNATYTGSPT